MANENFARIDAVLAKHKITVTAVFVPLSKSRNAAEKRRTLNWTVTLCTEGKPVVTADYSAGEGHCPSYKHGDRSMWRDELLAWECEHGLPATRGDCVKPYAKPGGKPLMPDTRSVVYGLLSDSSAIDHPTFEDWAEDFDYDTDSRKAEATYRQCLETGLKLRAAFGDSALTELRAAFQDF